MEIIAGLEAIAIVVLLRIIRNLQNDKKKLAADLINSYGISRDLAVGQLQRDVIVQSLMLSPQLKQCDRVEVRQ
jgi:hypothetical protein